MEVHAHTHTPRKRWRHYLWEFLMLFLAVFCGFLAEYQLEHKIEKDRELQYIKSLYEDLRENDKMFSQELIKQRKRITIMDSMINMLNYPGSICGKEGLLYYFARMSPRLQTLTVNNRTFEQLKNSGNFRLIRKIETSNQIMAYYENVPMIRLIEELFFGEFDQYKSIASRIFDPAIFTSMEMKDGEIARTDLNPPLQSYDISLIKQLSVFAVYINGSGRGIIQRITELKHTGEAMISYLQKEYHLQ
ncbi:MAG: hypothetical protein E6H07_04480 [Bacteroidetes bacterium]|nr:MAG: hypothetical protein E6H07_04480 [Bacteroidota bacterium]